MVDISTLLKNIDNVIFENIDIDIDIDKVILENIDIDIDKAILQNIDINKISNRFKFGISNRATCLLNKARSPKLTEHFRHK